MLFPQTELELANIVKQAGALKCKVRVAGTGGSVDGIVQQKTETNVIVVSLAKLQIDAQWDGVLDETTQTVRINAGKTFIDLMAVVRPKGYLLSSSTLGRYFTLGGVFMNPSTHGATKGESFLANYIMGIRALLSNGRYVVITNRKELQYWRGSLGLLGIAVGLEIQLRKDTGILMQTSGIQVSIPPSLTEINTFLQTNVDNSDSAQFFFNFWNNTFIALTYSNNGDPFFNYSATAAYYQELQQKYPDMAINGLNPIPASFFQSLHLPSIELAAAISDEAETSLKETWLVGNTLGRDGFYEDFEIIKFYIVQKFIKCPIDCIQDGTVYQLLIGTYKIIFSDIEYQLPGLTFYPSLDIEFRFLDVTPENKNLMLLNPLSVGKYVSFEYECAQGLMSFDDGYRLLFQRLERFWEQVGALGFSSHLGKGWGFDRMEGAPYPVPFQDPNLVYNYYNPQVKKEFAKYAKKVDKNGVFAAGDGLRLLGLAGAVDFEYRSLDGQTCQTNIDCITGCCCLNIPTCNATSPSSFMTCIDCQSALL